MNTASERAKAKEAITGRAEADPELSNAISEADALNVELTKESHRHELEMASQERGAMGRFFGGEKHAPTFIAFVAMSAGLLIGTLCLIAAFNDTADRAFWGSQAERALAFAGAALAFIFGRGLGNG